MNAVIVMRKRFLKNTWKKLNPNVYFPFKIICSEYYRVMLALSERTVISSRAVFYREQLRNQASELQFTIKLDDISVEYLGGFSQLQLVTP